MFDKNHSIRNERLLSRSIAKPYFRLQNVSLIPGLPDDLSLRCLARISQGYYGLLECVSKKWRDAIRSEEYARLKALEGWCGNLIFVSTENGSTLEAYDTEADRWVPIPVVPVTQSHSCNGIVGFSCVTVCKKLLLIGGKTLSSLHQEVLSDVSVFDPFKKEWYMGARMRRARLGFACAAISGKVYVAGGQNLACPLGFCDAEVYDPCTDRWEDLPPMPFPLIGCFSLTHGDQFYVFGRKEPSTVHYTHIIFDTIEHEWQVPTDNSSLYVNFWLSSVINEMLYVFDEETLEVVAPREFELSDSYPTLFLPGHERPLRPFGSCIVGYKRRVYLIGGLTLKFDTELHEYSVLKLDSTQFCEATRFPWEWEKARPMLSQAGRVVGCAVMTE